MTLSNLFKTSVSQLFHQVKQKKEKRWEKELPQYRGSVRIMLDNKSTFLEQYLAYCIYLNVLASLSIMVMKKERDCIFI